jgi:hypothetical protein
VLGVVPTSFAAGSRAAGRPPPRNRRADPSASILESFGGRLIIYWKHTVGEIKLIRSVPYERCK